MNDDKILNLRNNTENAITYFSNKLAFTLDPMELKNLSEKNDIKIIDVRMQSDYKIAHIPKSISIPFAELKNRLQELSQNDLHILYSYNSICNLATQSAYILAKNNYSSMTLNGGYTSWAEDFHFATE